MSIREKLESMGIVVRDDKPEAGPERDGFFTLEGCRLIVGPVTSAAIAREGDPTRLGSTANIKKEDVKPNEGLADTHPLELAREMALRLAVTSLDFAISGAGAMDNLKRCLRVDLSVAATPNFERCGFIRARVANFFALTFGAEFRPIVSTVCVAANPRGALLAMTAEYVVAPNNA